MFLNSLWWPMSCKSLRTPGLHYIIQFSMFNINGSLSRSWDLKNRSIILRTNPWPSPTLCQKVTSPSFLFCQNLFLGNTYDVIIAFCASHHDLLCGLTFWYLPGRFDVRGFHSIELLFIYQYNRNIGYIINALSFYTIVSTKLEGHIFSTDDNKRRKILRGENQRGIIDMSATLQKSQYKKVLA